jgi:hypothetical protein
MAKLSDSISLTLSMRLNCMRNLEPGAAVKSSGSTGRNAMTLAKCTSFSKALYESWDYERSNNYSQNRNVLIAPSF